MEKKYENGPSALWTVDIKITSPDLEHKMVTLTHGEIAY